MVFEIWKYIFMEGDVLRNYHFLRRYFVDPVVEVVLCKAQEYPFGADWGKLRLLNFLSYTYEGLTAKDFDVLKRRAPLVPQLKRSLV